MQKVKIVAVSDTHGCVSFGKIASYAIRRHADVVVVAGDIQTAHVGEYAEDHFRGAFLAPVRRLMDHCIEVVAIPGNHDFYLQALLSADRRRRLASNLHVLCDDKVKVCGLTFYGTPWVPHINGCWAYERLDCELEDRFSKIPNGVDILISHTPPIGQGDNELWDVSTQDDYRYWRHFGSDMLRRAIQCKKPKCVVCGHIHSGDHGLNCIDETAIINCSLIDELYKEAYKPAEIVVCVGDDGKKTMRFRTNGGMKWRTLNNTKKEK